jgi:hypothetical protein
LTWLTGAGPLDLVEDRDRAAGPGGLDQVSRFAPIDSPSWPADTIAQESLVG